MITCPWCGTNYLAFQPNCKNCGGPLPPAGTEIASPAAGTEPPTPPLPPRSISKSYVWRLLSSEGSAIAALVFTSLGLVFGVVGAGLTLGVITAFVGIPFLLLGIIFFGAGAAVLIWRYQGAQKVVRVLREGEAARGQILDLQQNYSVRVNGRHPWVIRYAFQAQGQKYEGKVTTLNQPGQQLQAGNAACILYLPDAPQWNSIYPHP